MSTLAAMQVRESQAIPVTANPKQTSRAWRDWFLLTLWTGVLAFYGLNAGFLYRTEALRALVGRNMLHSGDFLVPTLYGEPLLTKGPVMYAAIAAVGWCFGEVTTWNARIPAALAAIFTAWLVFWHLLRYTDQSASLPSLNLSRKESDYRKPAELQRQASGKRPMVCLTRTQALLIACMISCNPLWLDKATTAEIDMLVVFWVALALVTFFRAVDGENPATVAAQQQSGNSARSRTSLESYFWWMLALLAVALGTLTKWHTAVFFYATVLAYLWWTRRLHWLWRGEHLAGLALASLFMAGWLTIVVQRVGWPTLRDTLWQQALPRLSPAHQHGERLWLQTPLHPLKMLLCGLPWSLFVGLACWRRFYLHRAEPGTVTNRLTPATQALLRTWHCWVWPSLLLFTLLPDHDARHSMPLLTGLVALGATACLLALSPNMDASIRRLAQIGLVTLLAGFSVAAVLSLPVGWQRLLPSQWPIAALLWFVAATVLMAGWWSAHRQRWSATVVGLVVVWLVVKIAFAELVVPIRSVRDPVGKAAILKRSVPSGEPLYIFEAKDEGIMFYYGGPVFRVRGWERLPPREQVYCLAVPRELHALANNPRWYVVWQLPFLDEQGDPIVLVLLQARNHPSSALTKGST